MSDKTPQNILANMGPLLPDLESVYKDIHSHPELSMQENRTAGIAAERRFDTRKSPLSGSQRLAVKPANAILNYLYAIFESESRLAPAAVGLDPGLGVISQGFDAAIVKIMLIDDVSMTTMRMLVTCHARFSRLSGYPRSLWNRGCLAPM